jgi:hypothetical protein
VSRLKDPRQLNLDDWVTSPAANTAGALNPETDPLRTAAAFGTASAVTTTTPTTPTAHQQSKG